MNTIKKFRISWYLAVMECRERGSWTWFQRCRYFIPIVIENYTFSIRET